MHIIQSPLFDFEAFISQKENNRLVKILEALPAEKILIALEQEHWTGRKGYSVRGMWSALIAGLLYNCHSLADVVRLLKRDKETRLICGFSKDNMPGEDALGRFLKKLVKHAGLFDECIQDMVNLLRELLQGLALSWQWIARISWLILMVIESTPQTRMLAGEPRRKVIAGAKRRLEKALIRKGRKRRRISTTGLAINCIC